MGALAVGEADGGEDKGAVILAAWTATVGSAGTTRVAWVGLNQAAESLSGPKDLSGAGPEDALYNDVEPAAPAGESKAGSVGTKVLIQNSEVKWGEVYEKIKTEAETLTLQEKDATSLKALGDQAAEALKAAKERPEGQNEGMTLKARIGVARYGLELRHFKGEKDDHLEKARTQLSTAWEKEGVESETLFAQAMLLAGGMSAGGGEMTLRINAELAAVTGLKEGQEVTLGLRQAGDELVWATKPGTEGPAMVLADGKGKLAELSSMKPKDASMVMLVNPGKSGYQVIAFKEGKEGVEVWRVESNKGIRATVNEKSLEKALDHNLDVYFSKKGTTTELAEKATKFLWNLLPGWKDVWTSVVGVLVKESEADYKARKGAVETNLAWLDDAVKVLNEALSEAENLRATGRDRWTAVRESLVKLGVSGEEADRLLGERKARRDRYLETAGGVFKSSGPIGRTGLELGRIREAGKLTSSGRKRLGIWVAKWRRQRRNWRPGATWVVNWNQG